jgi:transposase
MELYAGIDLHSNNNYLAITDNQDKHIYEKRLPNEPDVILAELTPFQEELVGITVESTFNWYWLVDTLMDNGYRIHLANPAGIQKYTGLKYSNDRHDAFWLAHLLRLGILPEGYIYPKEDRPMRDLLRKRGHLVQLRTSLINSLQGIISRNCGCRLSGNKIKRFKENHIAPLLADQEDLALSGEVSKNAIDFLSKQITAIENVVLSKVKLKDQFLGLQTIPGLGKILAMTIMLETGKIERFRKVGNFSSYCRKVPSKWTSNDVKKGKGNVKNGNKYLAWAFSEVAEFARRYDESAKAFFNRKAGKTNRMIAHGALAHKLARAAYYIMRDNVAFDQKKLFS